jgi:hypothetical protein
MAKVISDDEKATLTYESAWTRLTDHQKSKQANGNTEPVAG